MSQKWGKIIYEKERERKKWEVLSHPICNTQYKSAIHETHLKEGATRRRTIVAFRVDGPSLQEGAIDSEGTNKNSGPGLPGSIEDDSGR